MTCYSDMQMAAALRRAGVGPGDAAYLVATAHPESGGCDVIQQGQPYGTTGWGVWQITPGNSEPQFGINNQLLSLQNNANAAAAKLNSQGLGAWTTITSGAYSSYFTAAKQAVATVWGMSAAEVNKLAKSPGKGSTQQAQTTSALGSIGNFLGLNNFNQLVPDILGSITSNKSVKDVMIRGGLIVLGGLMLLIGVIMLAGGKGAKTAINVVAPESRVASVVSGTASSEAAARRRANIRSEQSYAVRAERERATTEAQAERRAARRANNS